MYVVNPYLIYFFLYNFESGDELKDEFSKYGEIGDVFIPRHVPSMESKGYGFVRYIRQEDADIAVEKMEGFEIDGKMLRVAIAQNARREPRPRENRNSRDYGRDRDREYGRDRDREYSRDRDREYGRDRDRGYGRDRDRGYGRDRDRENGRDRDREYGRDRDREYNSSRNGDRDHGRGGPYDFSRPDRDRSKARDASSRDHAVGGSYHAVDGLINDNDRLRDMNGER